MSWLGLYLRVQRVPQAVATVVASTVVLWGLAKLVDEPALGMRLMFLAVGTGVGVAATSLASVDVGLDRAAAIVWPPRRIGHVLMLAVLVAGTVLLVQLLGDGEFLPGEVVLRGVVGLVGLAAFGATVFGGQLAWCLPVGWTVFALAAPGSGTETMRVAAWLVQPSDVTTSMITAMVLGVAGTATYAVAGCRR